MPSSVPLTRAITISGVRQSLLHPDIRAFRQQGLLRVCWCCGGSGWIPGAFRARGRRRHGPHVTQGAKGESTVLPPLARCSGSWHVCSAPQGRNCRLFPAGAGCLLEGCPSPGLCLAEPPPRSTYATIKASWRPPAGLTRQYLSGNASCRLSSAAGA